VQPPAGIDCRNQAVEALPWFFVLPGTRFDVRRFVHGAFGLRYHVRCVRPCPSGLPMSGRYGRVLCRRAGFGVALSYRLSYRPLVAATTEASPHIPRSE